MPQTQLTDRAVLAVTGQGAGAFLQGLVTNEMAKANPGSSAYAALLTPQGKIITDFHIHAAPDGYWLDVAATQADDLLRRLRLYRLRAPIGLEDVTATHAVFAAWDETATAPADPRLTALGTRWIAALDSPPPAAKGGHWSSSAPGGEVRREAQEGGQLAEGGRGSVQASGQDHLAAYHAHRLALGVPDSADTQGQFALDANLEELNGLDFRKGCYVGQEVTARMKHKAAPRRRLVPVHGTGTLPPAGTRLRTPDGAEAGELATGSGGTAMASLRLDRLSGTGPSLVTPEEKQLQVAVPDYLQPALSAAFAKN